jgi:hypothetical protein
MCEERWIFFSTCRLIFSGTISLQFVVFHHPLWHWDMGRFLAQLTSSVLSLGWPGSIGSPGSTEIKNMRGPISTVTHQSVSSALLLPSEMKYLSFWCTGQWMMASFLGPCRAFSRERISSLFDSLSLCLQKASLHINSAMTRMVAKAHGHNKCL